MDQNLTSPTARKAHKRLDYRQWAQARSDYEDGYSVEHLAKVYGVSRQTLDRRRTLDRWMRHGPGRLAPLNAAAEPLPPSATLEDAVGALNDRILTAYNADDRDTVRELAGLAYLLNRTARQFAQWTAPAHASDAPRVFTPARDIFDLIKERLGVDEDGNPVR